ncbi:MAG: hypothetical protein JXA33_26760 [Anaerolineae bacterium]|nr:hypothetical protein [Anaerolineae bacterium]
MIDSSFPWVNLTPEAGNYTFGYYDRCAWDAGNQYHLALHIPQQTRLPAPGELAGVGYVTREERCFHKIGETSAWCHQQGAMTLWLRHRPHTFIYNDFVEDGSAWKPIARIYSLDKGDVGHYDVPIYAISSDGRWGATLNFGRIPRRGYSYALAPLPAEHSVPDLDNDGLFIVDMHTKETRLIASYRQLIARHPFSYDLVRDNGEYVYMWLNHTIFNCDAGRVMVLFRYSPAIDQPKPWRTFMYTMRLDGSDLRCSLSDLYWRGAISHQIWGRTPGEILVDANWGSHEHGSEYIVFDETHYPFQAQRISRGMGPAGHLNFSPDGEWLVADTYPDREGIQRLALVDVSTGDWVELGRFRHQTPGAVGDIRCDLHPRWSADGTLLTVDTIHEGERKIYLLDMENASVIG